MAKKKNNEKPKIEIENIRLSQNYKDSLVAKYVREKFDKRLDAVKISISKCLESEHQKLFPELIGVTQEVQKKWFEHTGSFRIRIARPLGGYKDFSTQNYYPRPRDCSYSYRFDITAPSEETLFHVNAFMDVEQESDKFRSEFIRILQAVNTSKQLCELIPELSPLFPKRITGITGSPCTQLVPIDLIRSVRESFRVNTDEVQEVR